MIQTLPVGNENGIFVVEPILIHALASRLRWVLESSDAEKVAINDGLAHWEDNAVTMNALGNTSSTLWFTESMPESFLVCMRGQALSPVSAGTLNLMACAVNDDGGPLQFASEVPAQTVNARRLYRSTFEANARSQPGWTGIRRFPGRVLLSERKDMWVQGGVEYELVFAKIGPRLMLYINGERIHDVIDREPLGAGHFALRIWNSRVRWSNLDIYQLYFVECNDAVTSSWLQLPDCHRKRVAGLLEFAENCRIPGQPEGVYSCRPGERERIREPVGAVNGLHVLMGTLHAVPRSVRAAWVELILSERDQATGILNDPKNPDGQLRSHNTLTRTLARLGLEVGQAFERSEFPEQCASVDSVVQWLESRDWDHASYGPGSHTQWMMRALAGHLRFRHQGNAVWNAVIGWLRNRQDPVTGMWGSAEESAGCRINSVYKLVRWLYTPFGIPVPLPEKILDFALNTQTEHGHWHAMSDCSIMDAAYVIYEMARRLPREDLDDERLLHAVDRILRLWDHNRSADGSYPRTLVEPGVKPEPGQLEGSVCFAHTLFIADAIQQMLRSKVY